MSSLAPSRRRVDGGALLALFFAQAFFACFPVLGKIAMKEASPMAIAACRVVFGALFLTIAAAFAARGDPPMTWRERGVLALLATLGVVLNQTLYITGLSRSTAADVALLACTIPIFVLVIGAALGLERPGLRRAAGIPIALAGTLVILNLHKLDFHDDMFVGNLLIVVNCFFYAFFLVFARGILARRSVVGVMAAIFRYGALPIVLIALPSLRAFHPSALSSRAVLSIAAIILFPTILAYLLNAWALARTDASTTAVFHYVQPLLAWVLAWVVLGERPGPRFLLSAALIFAGVALTTWPSRAARTEHAPAEEALE